MLFYDEVCVIYIYIFCKKAAFYHPEQTQFFYLQNHSLTLVGDNLKEVPALVDVY